MRKKVLLICSECLSRNHVMTVREDDDKPLTEIKKFCPKCGKYTIHKISK